MTATNPLVKTRPSPAPSADPTTPAQPAQAHPDHCGQALKNQHQRGHPDSIHASDPDMTAVPDRKCVCSGRPTQRHANSFKPINKPTNVPINGSQRSTTCCHAMPQRPDVLPMSAPNNGRNNPAAAFTYMPAHGHGLQINPACHPYPGGPGGSANMAAGPPNQPDLTPLLLPLGPVEPTWRLDNAHATPAASFASQRLPSIGPLLNHTRGQCPPAPFSVGPPRAPARLSNYGAHRAGQPEYDAPPLPAHHPCVTVKDEFGREHSYVCFDCAMAMSPDSSEGWA